jgi:hypothetical protein
VSYCCPGCGRTDMAGITHVCPPVETFNPPLAFAFDGAREARAVASLYASEDSDRGFLARTILATAPFALSTEAAHRPLTPKPCNCTAICMDADDEEGTCKGLPMPPREPLVEFIVVPRRPPAGEQP